MTPQEILLSASANLTEVADARGRKLKVRRLTALDTLRLFKAAGPMLATNQPWLSMAMLAVAVTEIDGLPIPVPSSESQVEAAVERLGEDGLSAVADAIDGQYNPDEAAMIAAAGNSHGTPI